MTADITLLDTPISIKNYDIYEIENLPKLVFGFKIKNKFDEHRLKIKSKYKPRRIAHFKSNYQLEPVFLYGIEVKPRLQYVDLMNDLNDNSLMLSSDTDEEFYNKYKQKLNQYDLTCDECYRYACDGLYPIDSHHLDTISKTDYESEIECGFANMINKVDIPWYLSLANFNLYMLCRCTHYEF